MPLSPRPEPRVSRPRVLAEPIGGTPLCRAALDAATPPGWYVPRPRGGDAWRAHLEAVRPADGAWFDAVRGAIAPTGPAADRLQRVVDGRGILVTTGQQPGLFGGPLYTWLKALSALALADRLEAETGIPAAPLFWAATDDADFEEARWTAVTVGGTVRRLQVDRLGPDGRVLAEMPLGDVGAAFGALAEAAGSAAAAGWLDRVRAAYAPGTTIGDAYVALLRAVLTPLGVGVLDAWHPALRAAARPVLHEALRRAPSIDEAVALRSVAIERTGFRAQVARVPRLSLVFRAQDGIKERVPLAQAADIAGRVDAVLSANVLLRPVLERAVLPTAAYVGGPGEIAYFAQVSAVAEALELPAPLVVPRWSATIIEPAVDRMLGRLGLVLEDVREPHAAERRVAERAMPTSVRDALAAARAGMLAAVDGLEASAGDLLPPAVLEGTRRQLLHQHERLERRARAAVLRREQQATGDLAAVRAAVFPDQQRQERRLNLIPLLARHGEPLLEQLRQGAALHASSLLRR